MRVLASPLALVLSMLVAQTGATAAEHAEARFEPYPGDRSISVVPRKGELQFFPCEQCHQFMEPNTEIRELMAPHAIELDHGRGRLWCLTCHGSDNRDYLASLLGEPIDFDSSDLVCGGCHGNRHRDWYFGAHGKPAGNWQGERLVYGCTHCHNAHSPAIKPRGPQPPPPVRKGLHKPPTHAHETHIGGEPVQERDQ